MANTIKLLSTKQLVKSVATLKASRKQITLSIAFHALTTGNIEPLLQLGKKELSLLDENKQFVPAKFSAKSDSWEYSKDKAKKVFEMFNIEEGKPVLVWQQKDEAAWDAFVSAVDTFVKPEKEAKAELTKEEEAEKVMKSKKTKASNLAKWLHDNNIKLDDFQAMVRNELKAWEA